MTTVSLKTKRHLHGWCRAICSAVLIWSTAWVVFVVGEHTFQRSMPASFYFEYAQGSEIVPVKTVVNAREFASFKSSSVYHWPVKMRWEDTMYCTSTIDDRLHKKQTQVWEEFVLPDQPQATWQYRAQPFENTDRECQVRSMAIATTSLGYRKVRSFKSPWIKIIH